MEKLSRKEILSILGIGTDPKHSLSWYTKHYLCLRHIIKKLIAKEINEGGIFPLEAKKMDLQDQCINFSLLIKKKDSVSIAVAINDTDHGQVLKEQSFTNINDAINFFIEKSYCAGGSIEKFLQKRRGFLRILDVFRTFKKEPPDGGH